MSIYSHGIPELVVKCFSCRGNGIRLEAICMHRDEVQSKPCATFVSHRNLERFEQANVPLPCGHDASQVVPAKPCDVCDGTGLIST